MFADEMKATATKAEFYDELARQLGGLLTDERDWIANTANTAALLFGALPDVNWAGVYLLRGGELVLGPFQGRPACIRIALGKGVCGTAAATRHSIRVDDVDDFPGHIACDAASRSELVVPLIGRDRLGGDRLIGVLDLDSPSRARFDADDQIGVVRLAALLVAGSDFT
jgi:L-methionine (R)-S-oxide reductase